MANIQSLLFEAIRKRLPQHVPLEMKLAELLELEPMDIPSIISGETALSLEQAKKLGDAFQISLDGLTELKPSVIPFRFRALDYNLHSLRDYFTAILHELKSVDNWGPRRLIYAASDFPIFTLFQFPDLAAFKLYFWGRTVYDIESFKERKFSLEDVDKENLRLGEQAWRQYLKMPSIEIWSSDIVNKVLKQVFHAYKFGYFSKKEEAAHICDQITALLNHIEIQAQLGRKYHPDNYPPKRENYQLYYNEVSVSNNTVLFSSEDTDVSFVLQNALNYLVTDNRGFCLKTEAWLNSLIDKSTPISIHNQELRDNFFRQLRGNVAFVRERLV